MEVEGMPDGEITGSRIKIGAEGHPARNAMWIIGALVAIGGIFAFYKLSASSEEPKLKVLADFRDAFAKKCSSTEFEGPTPAFLKDQYLNSSRLQELVVAQAAALAGGAACPDVEQALRTGSFPLAAKH